MLCNAVLPTLVNWNCFQIRSSRGYDTPELAPVGGCHLDESRHVSEFINLAESIFEDINLDPIRVHNIRRLEEISIEQIEMNISELIREISQINVGEVKNRFHLVLMKEASVRYSKEMETFSLIKQNCNKLITDEVRHVYFSALIIENLSKSISQSQIESIYLKEFEIFNASIKSNFKH